jgi:hypothetical protein
MSPNTIDTETEAPARPVQQVGDRVFANVALGAGVLILVVLAGVAFFLIAEAAPAVVAPASELPGGHSLFAYIAPLIFGTILSAAIALIVATPLAVAVALFITHFAPPRLAQTLGYLVDLLAAVPSLIYGLWGASVLGPASVGLATWLNEWFGWLPFFTGPCLRHRAHHADGRPGAGGDDPADHHRGVAGGVPADPEAARGGGPGTGRHPLGDDQDGCAAVSAAPVSSAARCSAWVARWARRWPSPSCCRCPVWSRST